MYIKQAEERSLELSRSTAAGGGSEGGGRGGSSSPARVQELERALQEAQASVTLARELAEELATTPLCCY
jgi:hypothetical protein